MGDYKILVGDNRATLRTLADSSVHCIICSPSYFQLRRYAGDDAGIQIGAEDTPSAYIANLVAVFEECKRVLRDDGTLWCNLGDSFSGSGGGHKKGGANPGLSKSDVRSGATEEEAPHTYRAGAKRANGVIAEDSPRNRDGVGGVVGCKPKDLIGIPYRVALALRDAGWYWRAIIPWLKASAMPGSQLDRPTVATEYWLLFSKSEKYYYDQFAVLKPFADQRMGKDGSKQAPERGRGGRPRNDGYTKPNGADPSANGGRFRRDTDWFMESLSIIQEQGEGALLNADGSILAMHFNPGNARWEYCKHCATLYNSKQVKYIKDGACFSCGKTDGWVKHYAAYPLEMIEPLIRACTSEYGVCPTCGAPWVRVVEKNSHKGIRKAAHVPGNNDTKLSSTNWRPTMRAGDTWRPSCFHGTEQPIPQAELAADPTLLDDFEIEPFASIPATILDPFSGTGTTGIAALMHGRNYIGCELGVDYARASAARLRAVGQPAADVMPGQLPLELGEVEAGTTTEFVELPNVALVSEQLSLL